MTRLLIVDDDHNQLRLLARVISMRRRDLTVLTASHGLEAIEVLGSGPVDLVLTDLQMPEMNGFELLAWVLRHQPHVPVYLMTAFPAEAGGRLSELGSIECFTKPLDVQALLERVSRVLAEGARGHVRNISLPSFLQLLEMERKTCTLTVESGGRSGFLYLESGELVDARTSELDGNEAAMCILAWPDPAITILSGCVARQRTIGMPMSFLIMEALRLSDEEVQRAAPPAVPARVRAAPPLSRFPVHLPADASAIALLSTSGRVRTAAGTLDALDAHAALVAEMFVTKRTVIERLGLDDRLEEIVVTTRRHWTLVRPVLDPENLVMLVFDPERANLVMERRELASFVRGLELWCAQQSV
ncbi:MAG: response regulator [Sandaracinus sp.]